MVTERHRCVIIKWVLTMPETRVNSGYFLLLIFIHRDIVSAPSCLTTVSQKPRFGYWCKIHNASRVLEIRGVFRHQCVVSCMTTKDCAAVSHNFVHRLCILGLQLCDEVAPHPEFTVQLYGIDRSTCIHWKPTEEYDYSTAISYERTPSSG